MTQRRIHTRSKIFFPNPHVIRIDYGVDATNVSALRDWTTITRRAYRVITGTWGHSTLEHEVLGDMKTTDLISHSLVQRGYMCFADELDVLQFRLSVSSKAYRVHMWPERLFTIHEMVESP